MTDNRDNDCAGFFSALNVMMVTGFFFINPILALIVLAVLAVGAVGVSRPGRPHRPYQAPLTLDEAYRATGREPPSLGFSGAKPSFVKLSQGGAALCAALIVAAAIADIIAKVSHSDPAEVLPWVVSVPVLACVVGWALRQRSATKEIVR